MMRFSRFPGVLVSAGFSIFCLVFISSCLSGAAISADEYFSIGMAYYELGKYSEAERWLNRAKAADKTKEASEYNLGRIAFETGRYGEAAGYFENILKRDPENIMALKGAAYSRVKNGDLEKAGELYGRVLALVPESADDGYNYALILYAMEKYGESELVLLKYAYALDENSNALLLLARAQKAQGKVEAVDTYDKWVANNSGTAQTLSEYAEVLEKAGFFVRAIEQYRASLAVLGEDTETLKKSVLRFNLARGFFIADPESGEGEIELNAAIEAGFTDVEALEALSGEEGITASQRETILKAIDTINRGPETEVLETEGSETEGSETEGSETEVLEAEGPETEALKTDGEAGTGAPQE